MTLQHTKDGHDSRGRNYEAETQLPFRVSLLNLKVKSAIKHSTTAGSQTHQSDSWPLYLTLRELI